MMHRAGRMLLAVVLLFFLLCASSFTQSAEASYQQLLTEQQTELCFVANCFMQWQHPFALPATLTHLMLKYSFESAKLHAARLFFFFIVLYPLLLISKTRQKSIQKFHQVMKCFDFYINHPKLAPPLCPANGFNVQTARLQIHKERSA